MFQTEPMSAYLANPAIGASSAALILDSPRLFGDERAGLYHRSGTKATDFGTAFHARILQPETFVPMLSEGPINEKTGRCYGRDSKAWADWAGANPGKVVLTSEESDTMLLMEERMPAEVGAILRSSTARHEVSVYQTMDGVAAKCRPDSLDNDTITDLKTVEHIDGIRRAFRVYHYWFSQAWYRRMLWLETGRKHAHRFIFAEKSPPYRWRIVTVTDEVREESDMQVRGVLSAIASGQRSNEWPDLGPITQEITWPDCGHYEDIA